MQGKHTLSCVLLLYLFLALCSFCLLLPHAVNAQFLLGAQSWDFFNTTPNIPYASWGNYGIIPGQQISFFNNWGDYGITYGQQAPYFSNWGSNVIWSPQESTFPKTQGYYGYLTGQLFPDYIAPDTANPYSFAPPAAPYVYEIRPNWGVGTFSPLPVGAFTKTPQEDHFSQFAIIVDVSE